MRFLPLVLILVLACSKEVTDHTVKPKTPLELKADTVYNYVVNQHFIPVAFYADHPIDYNQDDVKIDSLVNLKDFIYKYLTDDRIIFGPDSILYVDQGDKQDTVHEKEFTMPWKVGIIKATNEVYIDYLSYTYKTQRYILDTFSNSVMVAHVP